MTNSSSSLTPVGQRQLEDISPLPLIRCPRCNIGVTQWWVSSTTKNPGRHFYKCEFQPRSCSFFRWEDQYIDYLRSRWGVFFNAGGGPRPQDPSRAILLQMQSEFRNIMFMGIGILFGVLMLVGYKF